MGLVDVVHHTVGHVFQCDGHAGRLVML